MNNPNLNRLLEKQIKRTFRGKEPEFSPEVRKLLDSVNASYHHFERDRKILERAMQLSSEEIRASYEQKIIQNEIQRSNEQLKQFVASASHDLKAPLRTIYSFTQILNMQLEGSLNEETQEYMDFILSGVKSMQDLLKDLSNFAKIGLEKESKKIVDFNLILEGVKRNLGYAIEESQATILVKNKLPIHLAYSHQVIQLFQNLIGNALKFRKDDVKPVIIIQCEETPEFFQISIADNGIGMDQQKHAKAFEAFSRLSYKTDVAGSGLGLSICKKVVETWGGTIRFESEPQVGTTFFITLPKNTENTATNNVKIPAEKVI